MRLIVPLLLLCLSLLGPSAHAATVNGLYQVREPIASQQPDERNAALGRALDTLVLRLTGDPRASSSPALAGLRKDPQQVISRYEYEEDALLVDFDPASTDRSLRQAGLAVWGVNRPAILAWWLNEEVSGSSLVGDGQGSAEPLRRAAQHRGLPLQLPLADLSEQLVGTAENLQANTPGALREASERYAADALLAVRAREGNGQWQADWRLWLGDEREQGKAQAADQAALADAVLLAVSEKLAPRFVVAPGAARSLVVEIQGTDLKRYAELQGILEPLGAQLLDMQGDRLTYRVSASAEQLRAQLTLAHLRELPAEAAVSPSEPGGAAQSPGAPGQAAADEVLRFGW